MIKLHSNYKEKMKVSLTATIAIFAILFLFASPGLLTSGAMSAPQGSQPSAVKGCGTSACTYISNYNTSNPQVSVLNGTKLLATIKLPTSSQAFGVTYVPTVNRIFVSDYGLAELLVINPATNTIVGKVKNVPEATFMTFDSKNGMLYVAQFGAGSVAEVNVTSLKVVKTITVCAADPEFLDYNTVDGMIYVPARTACYSVINPSTGKATTVSLGTAPTGVAVNQKTGNVYITDSSTNVTYVVKGSKLVTTIKSSEFTDGRLWGAFYDSATATVYVVASGKAVNGIYPRGTVIPISSTNKVGKAIKVGQGPDLGCMVTSTGTVLVTNTHGGVPGNVTLISSTGKVLKTIKLGKTASEPYGCATS